MLRVLNTRGQGAPVIIIPGEIRAPEKVVHGDIGGHPEQGSDFQGRAWSAAAIPIMRGLALRARIAWKAALNGSLLLFHQGSTDTGAGPDRIPGRACDAYVTSAVGAYLRLPSCLIRLMRCPTMPGQIGAR